MNPDSLVFKVRRENYRNDSKIKSIYLVGRGVVTKMSKIRELLLFHPNFVFLNAKDNSDCTYEMLKRVILNQEKNTIFKKHTGLLRKIIMAGGYIKYINDLEEKIGNPKVTGKSVNKKT